VNFGEAINAGLNHAFSVKGRASRSEHWYFFVLMLMLAGLLWVEMLLSGFVLRHGAPDIVNLWRQVQLLQITQPLSTVADTIGLLALLAALALFLLGTGLTLLALIVPLLTLQVRRLHDSGRSGWWVVNANLAWMAGSSILALGSQPEKPVISLTAAVIAFGFFAVPVTMLYLLARPGDLDVNKYDYDRPEPSRRTAPPRLSRDRSLPPAVTPAE
jgi:uncharacterized membrane protein YhaH (DUF805 family)